MNAARKPLEPLPAAHILDCTAEEYHKDPCAVPSLSSSTAHVLISQSPLHAWTRHPKYAESGDDEAMEAEDDDTKAKSNGTLVHRLLLGKGADLAVIEADNFKTKLARELRDEAKAAGKLPILVARLDELTDVVKILRARCADFGYEFNGQSEIPIEWYERGIDGQPVVCRSMIDHAYLDDGASYDVKTIRSASPEHIARTFIEHGYHIQDCAYTRAHEQLRPALTGRVDLTFLFMEIEPPYAVVPVVPDGAIQEIGRQHWARAVSVWQQCLASGEWPSYCSSRITIEAPPWAVTKHLGHEWADAK